MGEGHRLAASNLIPSCPLRFREAELALWEEWDLHAELADQWAREHQPTLDVLRSRRDPATEQQQREAFERQFETGTAKAVVALAFEDWRDSVLPSRKQRRRPN
eukprot:GGOE01015317.1.p3 GENE.GGOE01015317.1~~GGOE01015317.1.p3  ORF type:complete len:104 (+),score=22.34 GGOE01015317.1:560-871(+)